MPTASKTPVDASLSGGLPTETRQVLVREHLPQDFVGLKGTINDTAKTSASFAITSASSFGIGGDLTAADAGITLNNGAVTQGSVDFFATDGTVFLLPDNVMPGFDFDLGAIQGTIV